MDRMGEQLLDDNSQYPDVSEHLVSIYSLITMLLRFPAPIPVNTSFPAWAYLPGMCIPQK